MSIHDGHRDRMRRQLKTSSMDSLSDVQVLEVLLYYAAPRGDTNPTAHALLSRFGTLDSVFSAPESELKKVNGVGDAAAQLIRLVPQVARRCLMSRSAQIEILDTTSKCGQYLLPYFHGESEEVVYLLCLDAKCKALDCVLIHRGGVNVASIAARKVVKAALDANATSVVLAHNHPSGIAVPSSEDVQTTCRVAMALNAVEIQLADHIVVADGDYVSMVQSGYRLDEGSYYGQIQAGIGLKALRRSASGHRSADKRRELGTAGADAAGRHRLRQDLHHGLGH